MAVKDDLRNLLEKFEHNGARWILVAVGVIIFLRLRLITFAAALPVLAYWHFSNQVEENVDQEPDLHDDSGDPGTDQHGGWPPEEDDDQFRGSPDFELDKDEDGDPYGESFWTQVERNAAAPKKSAGAAPWRNGSATTPQQDTSQRPSDDFGLGDLGLGQGDPFRSGSDPSQPYPWDEGPGPKPGAGRSGGETGGSRGAPPKDDLDDFLSSFGKSSGGGGGGGGGALDDFDLFGGGGGGGGDDLDFLGGGGGGGMGGGFGRGKGGGKGKGKSKDKGGGGKGGDPNAPREANPKQVFVAGVADMPEEEIKSFFEEMGEVDRLKILRNPDGASKGVCFVTFRTEDQAQQALTLHGTQLEGRNLVVRLAHGGGGAGGASGGKGDRGDRGMDRGGGKGGSSFGLGAPDRGDRADRFGGGSDPMDFGSDRFASAFGGGDRGNDRGGGKGGGRGKGTGGGRRTDRNEMDDILEEALADADGPLKPGDFDFAARRFLAELRTRDRAESSTRFNEALEMVFKYTSSKDRSSVRKWPAYIFTLLQKFDPHLWEELRERDAERKREKGGGGFGRRDDREAPGDDDVLRARRQAPPEGEGKQVLDRWGKPVLL